jgi:hypothetical protein
VCQERHWCAAAIGRLLDHLVGAGEQRGRDGDANCLGGCRVDDKLHLRRKFSRQIGWLRTFQNPVDEVGSAAKVLTQVDAVADDISQDRLGLCDVAVATRRTSFLLIPLHRVLQALLRASAQIRLAAETRCATSLYFAHNFQRLAAPVPLLLALASTNVIAFPPNKFFEVPRQTIVTPGCRKNSENIKANNLSPCLIGMEACVGAHERQAAACPALVASLTSTRRPFFTS